MTNDQLEASAQAFLDAYSQPKALFNEAVCAAIKRYLSTLVGKSDDALLKVMQDAYETAWDKKVPFTECMSDVLAIVRAHDVANSQNEVIRLREAIKNFREGNYPHPRSYRHKPWRENEKPGQCPHGAHYWTECENCNDEYWAPIAAEGE